MISDEAATIWVGEVIRRNRSNNRLGRALRVSARVQRYTYASKWYTSILGLINHSSHQLAQLAKLIESEQLGRIEVPVLQVVIGHTNTTPLHLVHTAGLNGIQSKVVPIISLLECPCSISTR